MALEITGNVDLLNGFTTNGCYGRTTYNVNDNSTLVNISVEYWKDQTSYDTGKITLTANLPLNLLAEYDRTIDGEDVLYFTQIKVKERLENLGYSVVITDI